MSEYRKYIHVERLETEECEGLLDNNAVHITAKIDGTNGCVFWSDADHMVAVGSRNHQLTEAEDNAWFHRWVNGPTEEAKLLREYCQAHTDRIVYGEWMGANKFTGAFKHYDKAALGTFILFDVYDTQGQSFLGETEWRADLAEWGLEPYFVKVLAVLNHPSIEDVMAVARTNDYLLEGTGLVGEGVVCKVPGWKNRFGRTAYGKIVLSEFKKQAKPKAATSSAEAEIIECYMTDAELEKTAAKVCTACDEKAFNPSSRKMMGMLLSMCWKDLLAECPNWVKRMKNPTVDFAKLSGLCAARVKSHVEAN